MTGFDVVELCAGAGGQSLGLHLAGFRHRQAIELDAGAALTLKINLAALGDYDERDIVRVGDVADPGVWTPGEHKGVGLLAGGVPCPPFSVAGNQLGATDERDLFAWAVETSALVQPRAIMLENVRGLMGQRFAGYRQHVIDRLDDLGYVVFWKLLHASDFGVAQLRPRSVLVALRPVDSDYFEWPTPRTASSTVGSVLLDLMGARGWPGAKAWAQAADNIAPTIVGGSKKHGGADLGPTRAKRAWKSLGVNGLGIADAAPDLSSPPELAPKLTCEMVARLQGWLNEDEYSWTFTGRKTSRYRQIGNAFPPPVARAVGTQILKAFRREGPPRRTPCQPLGIQNATYRALQRSRGFVGLSTLQSALGDIDAATVLKQIEHLSRDFLIDEIQSNGQVAFRLGEFRAFRGQVNHPRHGFFAAKRSQIS